jgi:hypothetical protein
MTKRNEWDALGENGQYKMIIGCIVQAAQKRGIKVDPLAHVGGVFIRVAEQVDETELDLRLLCWKCAASELQQYGRHERKAAAAADFEVQGADGAALGSVLELIAGAGSVENEAVLRVDFSRFYAALDAVNKKIVDGLALGYSRCKIAPTVKMTPPAVTARIHKMRAALAVCMD